MPKTDYKAQITIVEDWVRNKGYDVKYVDGLMHEKGMYLYDQGEIQIHRHLKPEEKLYVLLHEVGHWILMSNIKWYRETFPVAFSIKRSATSIKQKIGVVEEEIAAWSRAVKIARKLKLQLDMKRFINFKTKCLAKHIDSMFLCEKL